MCEIQTASKVSARAQRDEAPRARAAQDAEIQTSTHAEGQQARTVELEARVGMEEVTQEGAMATLLLAEAEIQKSTNAESQHTFAVEARSLTVELEALRARHAGMEEEVSLS